MRVSARAADSDTGLAREARGLLARAPGAIAAQGGVKSGQKLLMDKLFMKF